MESNGNLPHGSEYMVILTAEEIQEMRLALAARSRMNGHGTRAQLVCTDILRKIDESETKPHVNGTAKVAGVDSSKWSGH